MSDNIRSLKTPLARARGLGSAKSGTAHWWALRLTSLALVFLAIYPFGILLTVAANGSYADVVDWLRSPYVAGAVILFIAVGFHHAANGLQVVLEDYLHCECSRTLSVIAVKFVAIALTVVGSLATLKIMLGV